MSLAADLTDDHGRLLIPAATVLTQETIDQVIEHGIPRLVVKKHPAITAAQKKQTRRRTEAAAIDYNDPWLAHLRHHWLMGGQHEA